MLKTLIRLTCFINFCRPFFPQNSEAITSLVRDSVEVTSFDGTIASLAFMYQATLLANDHPIENATGSKLHILL